MKSLISLLLTLFLLGFIFGCGKKTNNSLNSESAPYETMYKDSFDILLHSMEPPYNYIDSLYTEMYIALKSMKHDKTTTCAKMVCKKVDKLVRLDTSKVNQIDYLEAKQIAQVVLKDKQGFIETAYKQYNLYPNESFERLGSLGSLFLATNNKDSAEFYLNRCKEVSMQNLNSKNEEIKEKSILGVIHSLVLLGQDKEAKDFLYGQLQQNPSEQIEEFIHSFYDDFDSFKQMEWHSVEEFNIE